jgi:mRNA-degrading endonuclease RelE of RelBE toxin-antitoxin system
LYYAKVKDDSEKNSGLEIKKELELRKNSLLRIREAKYRLSYRPNEAANSTISKSQTLYKTICGDNPIRIPKAELN